MESFLSLEQGSEACVVEKKSRFIAQIAPVSSEDEANAFIEQIKKKHYDARHNCFAYSVGGEKLITRYSDDGEPQGTAGKPIMEVINGSGIHNICVVVTRYFGGTLLGTGGLVRAYTAATKEAVALCKTKTMKYVTPVDIVIGYSDLPRIQYILGNAGADVVGQDYDADVTLHVRIPAEQSERVLGQITEMTSGNAIIDAQDNIYA